MRTGGIPVLEQPAFSWMLKFKPIAEALREMGAVTAVRDVCRDGAPWKKSTAIAAPDAAVMQLNGRCRCPPGAAHQALRGRAPDGRSWTAIASPYLRPFAVRMARLWPQLRNIPMGCAHPRRAGAIGAGGGSLLALAPSGCVAFVGRGAAGRAAEYRRQQRLRGHRRLR